MQSCSRPITVLLRISVVLQCLGHARWMLDPRFGETPIFSLLWGDPEFGGLGWSEVTAQGTQYVVGWFFVAAALLTLARPCVYVLAPVAMVQTTIAVAMWRMDIGFLPEWAAPYEVLRLGIPLASQAIRIAAPIVLALVDPWQGDVVAKRLLSRTSDVNIGHQENAALEMRWRVAEIAMRWAIALTFVGHSLKAWSLSFSFQNLVSLSAQRWLGWSLSQTSLEHLVRAIGVMDLVLAVLLVTVRWRTVAWWMAFWGLVTAVSRITYSGWTAGNHQTIMRAAHAGVPAALALYWSWRRRASANKQREGSPKKRPPRDGDSV